jgi:hypothetical protein
LIVLGPNQMYRETAFAVSLSFYSEMKRWV